MQLAKRGTTTIFVCSQGTYVSDEISDETFNELVMRKLKGELKEDCVLEHFITGEQGKEIRQDRVLSENMTRAIESGIIVDAGNGVYYRKGIDLSLPKMLLSAYVREIQEWYNRPEDLAAAIEPLDNFWKWCALNPDPVARHELFEFLKVGNFPIMDSGLFITYRNVNIYKQADDALADFVKNEYFRKKKWKKSPKRYDVWLWPDGKYTVLKENKELGEAERIGNLAELYEEVSCESQTCYTDAFSGKFRIRIGEPVKQERKDCDNNPRKDCSNGLHVGNVNFLHQGSFGSIGLICLVNPMNVVAVPEYNKNKMRVCEYLPIAEAEYVDGRLVEVNTGVYEDDYSEYSVGELNKMLEQADLKEHIVNTVTINSGATIFKKIDEYTKAMEDVVKNKNVQLEIFEDHGWEDEEDNNIY